MKILITGERGQSSFSVPGSFLLSLRGAQCPEAVSHSFNIGKKRDCHACLQQARNDAYYVTASSPKGCVAVSEDCKVVSENMNSANELKKIAKLLKKQGMGNI